MQDYDLDQIRGVPYGDAFIVHTPTLDRVSQQLQQYNAARQAFQQKETEQASNILNKELANVRSADMSSVLDAYNKWKGIRKNMLFDKKLQANPKAYNEAQGEANAAYGDALGKINKSVQLNQFGKQLYSERNTPGKANLYADDFGDKAAAYWSTPMDQLQSHKLGDLTNPDTYRYQGMNNVDFGKLEKTAAGTPSQKYQAEQKISALQKNITPYTFGNTPAQYQEALRGQFASTPQVHRAALAAWDNIPQSERDRVDQLYANIPTDKWQKMGLEGPQAIGAVNPNDPVDQLAAYKAKLYAINNNPTPGKMYSNVNTEAKMDKQFDQRAAMEAIRQNDRVALKNLAHSFKKMDAQEQGSKLDEMYDDIVEDAKKSGTHTYESADGKVFKQYEIKASPLLKKQFSIPDDKGHPIYPDAFRINETGTSVTPLYFKPGPDGVKKAVDVSISKPVTGAEFKAILGKTLMGTKEANKASVGTEPEDATKPTNKTKKTIAGW